MNFWYELRFWYDIMSNCALGAIICGIIFSVVSLFCAFNVWVETEKYPKRYLLIPVVIVILGFCYYIGMERLAFEMDVNGPC